VSGRTRLLGDFHSLLAGCWATRCWPRCWRPALALLADRADVPELALGREPPASMWPSSRPWPGATARPPAAARAPGQCGAQPAPEPARGRATALT
jgi:hypothetical protein